MIAIISIYDGTLPPGAAEAVAECGGRALLVGSGVAGAADEIAGVATDLTLAEAGDFAPLAWSDALVEFLADESTLVIPGSVAGKALAPHLAVRLGIDFIAGAVSVSGQTAIVATGATEHDAIFERAVVVLTPGVRSVEAHDQAATIVSLDVGAWDGPYEDAALIELLPADPATLDLSTAQRIVAGGAGLKDAANLETLRDAGLSVGASLGATRVLTDVGWLENARQIGTTGVEIDPALYIAVGISGAVQHIMGIGNPDHIISVNTDATCPMMNRADLALVTDGPEFVVEFQKLLATTSEAEDV